MGQFEFWPELAESGTPALECPTAMSRLSFSEIVGDRWRPKAVVHRRLRDGPRVIQTVMLVPFPVCERGVPVFHFLDIVAGWAHRLPGVKSGKRRWMSQTGWDS